MALGLFLLSQLRTNAQYIFIGFELNLRENFDCYFWGVTKKIELTHLYNF